MNGVLGHLWALAVWGWARYLSVTEAAHSIESLRVAGRNILFLWNLNARAQFKPASSDFPIRQLIPLHQGPRPITWINCLCLFPAEININDHYTWKWRYYFYFRTHHLIRNDNDYLDILCFSIFRIWNTKKIHIFVPLWIPLCICHFWKWQMQHLYPKGRYMHHWGIYSNKVTS